MVTGLRQESESDFMGNRRATTYLRHAMIADENEQALLTIALILLLEVSKDTFDNLIHLHLLGSHQRALWPAEVTDMVEAEVVKDENVEGRG